MADDNSLIIRINGNAKNFLEELDKIKKKTADLETVLGATAKASALAFAGFAGAIAVVTSAFIDYEKALVGVGKTTNIEGQKLQDFGKQFQKMAQDVPIATNELLGIAQAAGQLGVSGEKNLLKFTETVAKLGVATDLSGEQAATTLVRILNATGEAVDTIDTFGSVIVALGNNFAASESEIARMANEVARATGVFGVTAAEAAALGTAMRAVGIQAEAGGSAVGKTFRTIDTIVRAGGPQLEKLAAVAGTTSAEFKKIFEQNKTEGFKLFVDGLGRVVAEGGSASQTLAQFRLKGDEINKVLPVLAKNSQLVGSALELAAKETKNATALNKEAEKAFATLGAEKQKLINVATDLASEIGEELAPTIKDIVIDLKNFIVGIKNSNSSIIPLIATFLKWGAIISGVVAGIVAFTLGAIKLSAAIAAISAVFLPATVAASAFWVALTGPIGLAVAGLAAATVGVIALTAAVNNVKPETIKELNDEIDKLKAKREDLVKNAEKSLFFKNEKAIENIDKEIDRLEELRKAKNLADADFGTGKLLIRPEADATAKLNLGASAFGIEEQTIPFRAEGDIEQGKVEQAVQTQDQITEANSKALQQRLDQLRAATREEQAILAARAEYETEEEKDLAEKKAEILNKKKEAAMLSNQQERELTLQLLEMQHEEELVAIDTQLAKIGEKKAKSAEEQRMLRDAFREEDLANRELITEEDLVALEEKQITEEELKKQYALAEAERIIAERNQRLEDEKQFGTTMAELGAFFRSQEVQGAKSASSELIKLTNSKNETLKGIGKAAAQTNAAISTAEGAIAAYKSLAGIPIVGPGLGFAAAAALTAYGLEQQQQIAALNSGGVVPGGGPNVDSQLVYATPGELIVPREDFNDVVEGAAQQRGFVNPDREGTGSNSGGGISEVLIGFKDEAFEIIEQKLYTRSRQNIGRT